MPVVGSARVGLAVSLLARGVGIAATRDFADDEEQEGPDGERTPSQDVIYFVLSALGHILSPRIWRFRLTGELPDSDVFSSPLTGLQAQPPRLASDYEDAALGLIRAFEFALGPWIEGQAGLDVKQLRALAAVVNPAVGKIVPDSWWHPDLQRPTPANVSLKWIVDPGTALPQSGPKKKHTTRGPHKQSSSHKGKRDR